MIKQLKQLKSKLNVRNSEILIGLFVLGKGLWLLHDSHYFSFPPQFKNIENSNFIDVGMIILGLALVASAFLTKYVSDTKLKIRLVISSKVFLVITGVVCIALALLQLTHGIFTPLYQMSHSAWGDLIIFGFVYLTASDA